ncbi:MAG: Yae1 family protein [Verrucomicrobiales bacterium]
MTWAESLKLEGRQEGRQEGWQEGIEIGSSLGKLRGQITTYQDLLGIPVFSDSILVEMPREELEQHVEKLKAEARKRFK